jgi:hypothetical protein
VKFTSSGGVLLRISRPEGVAFTGPLRSEPEVISFSVCDTGIGIAEDQLRLIFDAFRQADGTTSRRYGGTGLGLSISRDIARVLGGEIRADSMPGHGSTFTLYLPIRGVPAGITAGRAGSPGHRGESAGPAVPPPETMAVPDDALNGVKVLIVDDDVRNVFALTSVFERCGAEVLYAENGREGIDVLERNEDIALVLMDVMMPELDGYATTEAIRRMPQFADLPILAVTAKAMKGDREKTIAAGASDYITKPVDTGHLLGVMRSWLQRTAAR